ncbi:hypothetical protein JXI42_01720 [bacterium]|nr:hypothetical protein [bacterium]
MIAIVFRRIELAITAVSGSNENFQQTGVQPRINGLKPGRGCGIGIHELKLVAIQKLEETKRPVTFSS